MPLLPNERLGPYQILSPLGAGGMGEVYKAHDSRLGRVVAIKVAGDQFSERFDREARAIAALNHSNICQLYDVGPNYLVMEYIDGRPLAGPLPLEQVLKYAGQVLDALAAAHQKGIVHRDLKPANILITKGGVKLLDFGLARMEPVVSAGDETVTQALTGKGQILGTLHYMSPEQLHGQDAGPSSDVFSFGLVFYEMLTGKRAFEGQSAASLIAAILEREPPSLGTAAPPAVQAVLARCLKKDAEERWHSARDVKIALDLAAEAASSPVAAVRAPRRFGWVYPSIAAGALIAAAAIAVVHFTGTNPQPMSTAFEIAMPEGGGVLRGPIISPDGRQIVFRTGQGLMVRSLDSTAMRELPGTRLASRPSWSPDSRHLAFMQMSKLRRISIDSSASQVLCDVPGGGLGPPYSMWGPDGSILFTGAGSGLWKVPASGGVPVKVTTPAAGDVAIHMALGFLPDGRHFLFLNLGSKVAKNGIYVGSLDDLPAQDGKLVVATKFGGAFAPDGNGGGYLLFRRESALVAQPFDLRALQLTGEAFTVAPQVGTVGPLAQFSVSRTGVLAYAMGTSSPGAQLTWLDRTGKKTGDLGPPVTVIEMALSPDEKRLAYAINTSENLVDIWLIDVAAGSTPRRFTFDPVMFYRYPVWSPEGSHLLFASGFTTGVSFQKAVNGAGAEQRVEGMVGSPSDWSRDGRVVSMLEGDLWVWKDGKSERFTQTPAVETMARFSPDGKWIAYVSDETGRAEVWVQSYPATGAKYQVSTTGAAWPHWRRDGKELFYVSGRKIVASAVREDAAFEVGAGKELFAVGAQTDYAVAENGARFLVQVATGDRAPEQVIVKTNWLASLTK